jgi:diacylglycerol kinase (ATP)
MEGLRHVFIVNPTAGKSSCEKRVIQAVEACFSKLNEPYEIILTRAPMHAAQIARAQAQRGDPVRLYACGGDGTLSEVANGAAQYGNAQVAVFPIGTGNDYVKTFGKVEDFLNLAALVTGRVVSVDLIRIGDRFAVNLCSMGFDAEVAINLMRFKRLPLVTGGLAYNMSILYCLLKKMHTTFEIVIDTEKRFSGEFLLCAVANGQWYGGGYHAAPDARPCDGTLDIVIASAINRLGFIKMVNKYRTGRHESLKVLKHLTGKKFEISSPNDFAFNCDGECSYIKEAVFEIVPGAMNFIVPQSCFAKSGFDDTYKMLKQKA